MRKAGGKEERKMVISKKYMGRKESMVGGGKKERNKEGRKERTVDGERGRNEETVKKGVDNHSPHHSNRPKKKKKKKP